MAGLLSGDDATDFKIILVLVVLGGMGVYTAFAYLRMFWWRMKQRRQDRDANRYR